MIACYPKYVCLHIKAKELKAKYCSTVLAALLPGTKLLTTFLHCGVSTTLDLVGTHFHKIMYYFPEDFQKISCYFPEVVKNKGTLKDEKKKKFFCFVFFPPKKRKARNNMVKSLQCMLVLCCMKGYTNEM